MKDNIVSVIVPVYNAEEYLNNCLDSIICQTYSNLEIICVNDGSTDNSQSILHDYACRDRRIKVIDQKNSGVSSARNRGIDEATGEYITFVDSDDALDSDMYSIMVSIMEEEGVDIVHCGYRRIDPDGTVKDVSGTGTRVLQNPEEAIHCLLTGYLFAGGVVNKLYKKELFRDIHFQQNVRINEDVLANVYLFSKAEKSLFYDLPLYHYYNRERSATSTTDRYVKAKDCVFVAEKIWNLLKETVLSDDAAQRLYHSLIEMYRSCLFDGIDTHSEEKIYIRNRINCISSYCKGITIKSRLNYYILIFMPDIYKSLYSIYDKIRVPNWDVKA